MKYYQNLLKSNMISFGDILQYVTTWTEQTSKFIKTMEYSSTNKRSNKIKLIGRGWQYSVYDIGNNRVLKKSNSTLLSYYMMFHDSFPYTVNPPWKYHGINRRLRKNAKSSIDMIKNTRLPMWMFGNPSYLDGLDYEQDLAEPLRNVFARVSTEEGKHFIDAFVSFNEILIKNQLIDRGFAIGTNFSLNNSGKVILTDLGELMNIREEIDSVINERRWAEPYIFPALPKSLHKYLVDRMDSVFIDIKSDTKDSN